jgi:hypothetical protein
VRHLNIPEGEVAMDHGTGVRVTDGKAGRIERLVVDPMISGGFAGLWAVLRTVLILRTLREPTASNDQMEATTV